MDWKKITETELPPLGVEIMAINKYYNEEICSGDLNSKYLLVKFKTEERMKSLINTSFTHYLIIEAPKD